MQIIDRLLLFFRENDLSNYKVEQACGLTNGYLKNLRKAPSAEILEKIFLTYPALNRKWVMTGEGKMLNDVPSEPVSNDNNVIAALKETIAALKETIASQKITIESLTDQVKVLKGDIVVPHRSAETA